MQFSVTEVGLFDFVMFTIYYYYYNSAVLLLLLLLDNENTKLCTVR